MPLKSSWFCLLHHFCVVARVSTRTLASLIVFNAYDFLRSESIQLFTSTAIYVAVSGMKQSSRSFIIHRLFIVSLLQAHAAVIIAFKRISGICFMSPLLGFGLLTPFRLSHNDSPLQSKCKLQTNESRQKFSVSMPIWPFFTCVVLWRLNAMKYVARFFGKLIAFMMCAHHDEGFCFGFFLAVSLVFDLLFSH